VRSIYQGSNQTKGLRANRRFITPITLSAIPDLFRKGLLPLDFALIQVSPPDDNGWMSFGISVDVTQSAAQSAAKVIAQVNPNMPRTQGHSFIHIDDVDVIIEKEEELLSPYNLPDYESAADIAAITATLIDDGATLQLGLAELSRPIARALAEKNDLGVHTEILTDDLMALLLKASCRPAAPSAVKNYIKRCTTILPSNSDRLITSTTLPLLRKTIKWSLLTLRKTWTSADRYTPMRCHRTIFPG
jgi:acyl-CoA hydrolase